MPNLVPRRFSLRLIVLMGFSAVFAMLCLVVYAWDRIPSNVMVPAQWDSHQYPNAYCLKALVLLGMPALMMWITIIYSLGVQRVTDVEKLNRAAASLYITWLSVLILTSSAQVMIILTALGQVLPVTPIILVGTGLVLIVSGLGVVKHPDVGARSRFYSETVDRECTRISGIIICLMGMCVVPAALLNQVTTCVGIIIMGALSAIALRVYFAVAGQIRKA